VNKALLLLLGFYSYTAAAQTVAEEFRAIGTENVALVKQLDLPDFVAVSELEKVVETTEIRVEDSLSLRGAEVDAINYSDRRLIRVSKKRWDALKKYTPRKRYLVLHEYLGILEIELDHFASSSQIKREFELRETENQAVLDTAKSAFANTKQIMEELLSLDMNMLRTTLAEARNSQDFAQCIDDSFLWWNERKQQEASCNRLDLLIESMKNFVKAVNAPSRLNLSTTRWIWLSKAYPKATVLNQYSSEISDFTYACGRLASRLERSFPSYQVSLYKTFPDRFTAMDNVLKESAPKWPEAKAEYEKLLEAFRAAHPELE
jgi:hypothetical protein